MLERRKIEIAESIVRRLKRRDHVQQSQKLIDIEIEMCRRSVVHLATWWAWTFDPRNADGDVKLPTTLPFDLFPRQVEYMDWMDVRANTGTDGLVEKSRDSGFSWLGILWCWHRWRFVPGYTSIFGSRKQDLVDTIGDPDSLFEKMRMLMRNFPPWLLPVGFDGNKHDNFLRLINPENGNTITGEAGDEMGRGGRTTMYLFDEAAFIERMDQVDAATSATSRTRIFGSTVNGNGNWFYRKRFGATLTPEQVFVFDVADNPIHTPEWIAEKKRSLETHVYASEFGRDYSASVEGICIPGAWVESSLKIGAVLAERGIKLHPAVTGIAGLDVGGGGKARSVAVARFGPIVTVPESWGDPDTNETASRALDYAERQRPTRPRAGTPDIVCKVTLANYDSVGVGAGCLTVMKRGRPGLVGAGVNTGVPPSDRVWPDGKTSKERFGNLKAEIWFLARERLKKTHEMLLFLTGRPLEEGAHEHPLDEILILPPIAAGADAATLASQLSTVKWGRNEAGKEVMETKVQLRKRGIASPDHAEAFVLTFIENSVVNTWTKAFGGGR